jgi:D-3-phosphoglycerate dehydrogenase
MKILVSNLSETAKTILEDKSFEVLEVTVAQNQLENYIIENAIDAIIVDENTEIQEEVIENCSSLKLIASTASTTEHIDVDYALTNGVQVIKANSATVNAQAELVFAHLFGLARFLHQSNREMPLEGDFRFRDLQKTFAQGIELRGKKLGIIGFDAIGQQVAKIAIGLGMEVLAFDNQITEATIELEFFNGQRTTLIVETSPIETIYKEADFISLHETNVDEYIITASEFEKMKNGVGFVNIAKGGIVNEVDLVNAIESGKVQFAGLDVFETAPKPAVQLLMNSELSLSPSIGASTLESKIKVDEELARKIVQLLEE